MTTWKDILQTASKDQTLMRAQSALGLKTIYKLGKGGFDPAKPMTASCDCSGFVAWAIGLPRELPPKSDKWLDTDAYYMGGKPVKSGLFFEVKVIDAEPGDLLVYPDKGGSQGHIGIVTQVDLSAPTYVVHCSNGNYKNYNDAIRMTGPGVFLAGNHVSRAMRIDYDALKMLA